MDLPQPLIKGTLVQRYKRFLADVELESGETITAHVANSGSMMGMKEPGSTVWLSISDNPKRKLKHSWELMEIGDGFVGVNTSRPNHIVEEAISGGQIPELTGYPTLRREVKYGKNSRIDLLLEAEDKPPCYVEVKNVTLSREAGLAEFPDAVTARGTKHLHELMDQVQAGSRAVMFYLVQRQDCERFSVAADIDPKYGEALREALARGVEMFCYDCHITVEKITVNNRIELAL